MSQEPTEGMPVTTTGSPSEESLLWFSAALHFVGRIEGIGSVDTMRSIVVFRSADFDTALLRALEIGRGMEASSASDRGGGVRWYFMEIETVDMLGEALEDGREVHSRILPIPSGFAEEFPQTFAPEKSKPGYSGV
jgi:hypothetical protein